MAKAFVLLSGGIDSTTCLHIAAEDFGWDNVRGISLDYGQRHVKETEFAQSTCTAQQVPWQRLNLSGIVPRTMLTDKDAEVPAISYKEITGVSPTYVPYRNGFLLSAVASLVHGMYVAEHGSGKHDEEWAIYFGAHAEDAQNWAYPDCTPEFIGAMANAIYIGTYQAIRLRAPLMWLDKAAIIALGQSLGVDWSLTWSCYKGEGEHCGTCPTCRARQDGFRLAGVVDPTFYAEQVAA